jgi:serine/threonine-protein kinase
LWGGGFWTEYLDVPYLLIAGLLVHAAGLSMIGLGAAMQVLIARIDYSAPVLAIQRQLAQVRTLYVYGGLAVGLPWWLLPWLSSS